MDRRDARYNVIGGWLVDFAKGPIKSETVILYHPVII